MAEINWGLINDLATKPHKDLNIADDFEAQIASIPLSWVGEVFHGQTWPCDTQRMAEGTYIDSDGGALGWWRP